LTANSAPALPVNPAPGLAPIALLPWEETGDYTALHQALIAHHAPEGPVQVRVRMPGTRWPATRRARCGGRA